MIHRITIIDDDDISLYLTSVILEEADFAADVQTYTSVEEAQPYFNLLTETMDKPEILFLDLNMPERSGWDFLDMLQPFAHKLQNWLHIFVLTSSIAASDKARSEMYPIVRGFIHKPLDEESLLTIRRVLAATNR